MLATEYAQYYNIASQGEGESDFAFRSRVAGALRDQGRIIEAHEAQQDARYEDSDTVMTGIVGALAQAMQSVNYGRTGARQVGDDFAAGILIRNPKPQISPLEALLATLMAG